MHPLPSAEQAVYLGSASDNHSTLGRELPTDAHAVDFTPTVAAAAVPYTGAVRPDRTRSLTEPALHLGLASDNPTTPEREPQTDAHAMGFAPTLVTAAVLDTRAAWPERTRLDSAF
ncbi:hypothetical protein MRX96_000889 [Rhipicephalus microplus]